MIFFSAVYFGLSYFGGEWGRRLLYPIRLFVTFLHEFGHALGAILTGGWVEEVQINQDGSGWTRTVNGNRPLTIMGGYLGSALFGNFLFMIGAKFKKLAKPLIYFIILSMLITAFYWFNSLFTSGLLVFFSLLFFLLANKTAWASEVVMFLGLASVLYIIQDFNVGPRSDLKAYEEVMVIIPAQLWMYIWLAVAILLLFFNLKLLLKSES